jgi:hypothetical protein
MKKNALLSAILACGTVLAAPCHAFSLGGMASSMTGGSGGGGANLSASQTQTVADYVAGSQLIVAADLKMAQALHLDGEVSQLQAQADALKAGTSEDSLKKADVAVSASTQAIVDKLKTNPTMDAASKTTFSTGLAALAAGAIAYVKTGKDLSSTQSALSSASPTELMQVGELLYIAKTFPVNAKNFGQALSAGVQYAKGQNIPVPATVADATASLGSF